MKLFTKVHEKLRTIVIFRGEFENEKKIMIFFTQGHEILDSGNFVNRKLEGLRS